MKIGIRAQEHPLELLTKHVCISSPEICQCLLVFNIWLLFCLRQQLRDALLKLIKSRARREEFSPALGSSEEVLSELVNVASVRVTVPRLYFLDVAMVHPTVLLALVPAKSAPV